MEFKAADTFLTEFLQFHLKRFNQKSKLKEQPRSRDAACEQAAGGAAERRRCS